MWGFRSRLTAEDILCQNEGMRQTETNTHEILPPLLTTTSGSSRLVSARIHVSSMFPIITSLQGIAMVVTDEKNHKMTQDEPPPTYSLGPSLPGDPPGASTDARAQQPGHLTQTTLPRVKPCNYLSLTRTVNSVKGVFVVDPTLRIPSSLLPALEDGETEDDRKNLRLVSSHGSVDVNIFLLAGERGESETGTARTRMLVGSYNGSIVARLVSPPRSLMLP